MQNTNLPRRLSTKAIYESDWISLYADRVQMPDGSRMVRRRRMLRRENAMKRQDARCGV